MIPPPGTELAAIGKAQRGVVGQTQIDPRVEDQGIA